MQAEYGTKDVMENPDFGLDFLLLGKETPSRASTHEHNISGRTVTRFCRFLYFYMEKSRQIGYDNYILSLRQNPWVVFGRCVWGRECMKRTFVIIGELYG